MTKTSAARKLDIPYTQLPAEITTILDGYSDPSILVSADYRILAANRAYRNHYSQGDNLFNRYCYEISHNNSVSCDQAGEQCPLQNSRTTGEPHRLLHVHHTPNGTEHVYVETRPIRNKAGHILYYVEILRHTGIASTDSKTQGLVGNSPAFNRMLELAQRVAASETTVLLVGESGTGKELVARAIHEASERSKLPFVPVECSGLTESLFESEFFGHEKGAFTGAYAQKIGLVEAVHGGTLLLDEIGDIPLPLQVKLLRLLETGTYRRVGSVESKYTDFRLICATHRDLKKMVEVGAFRQDLYYRLNTFPITLPALRQRREDLPLLINTLLRRMTEPRKLSLHPDTIEILTNYHFPGNIRELRNILERASLLVDSNTILPMHLPEECRNAKNKLFQGQTPSDSGQRPNQGKWLGMETPGEIVPLHMVEERYLRQILANHQAAKWKLAEKLGISERTLYRKLHALRTTPLP